MASTNPDATLMGIPLELRHVIFGHAAARPNGPKKVFRHWFEKKEIAEKIAELVANNPDGVTPRALYEDDDDYSELAEEEDEEEGEDGEDSEDDDDDGGDDQEDEDEMDEDEVDEDDMDEDDMDEDDMDEDEGDADTETAPVITAAHKWHHIPKFMRITHCPPPTELLLTCKELNREAMNWYYDVAVLRIHATGSIAHTSFFEFAFEKITDAAFSPVENIRKVEVTFVWDTAWLRAKDSELPESVMQCMLRDRANFVVGILRRAPELKEVQIHWHDSIQDSESAVLKSDVLEGFNNLAANINIDEHYLSPGEEPDSRSIAGKHRLELQGIIDMGVGRLN